MKKIAILQSNYIPWKGYFDIINMVDEFVLYDDMQFTKRDWRNRNLIKTSSGLKWLTIPVNTKDKFYQKINETKVSDYSWVEKHWSFINHNYKKADCFNDFKNIFEIAYNSCKNEEYLSKINAIFLKTICNILDINTKITHSSIYDLGEGKTEKLVNICKQAKATHYLSGPAAKDYIQESMFEEANIKLEFVDYAGYPEYNQLYPPFEHGITILDLLFNVGEESSNYIWGWRNRKINSGGGGFKK